MSLRSAPELPGVELSEVIGTGGSGVVYRGRQVAFDRPVAVKVVPAGGTDSAVRRRWEREVAAIGRLTNHPNVVPVFDAGTTDDGTCYLVMPLVPGGSLGERIRREGTLDPAEVAGLGAKLAGALVAVHAAGVLHRDVKPDNVLCSAHGEPQLSDFGIARLQDVTATMSGSLQATVSYAAPEVLAGGEATEATDVYGLGATLYACLTGGAPHPPVPGEHLAASVQRAIEQDPPALADAGVPRALAEVVERALSRDPSRRQPDAATLRHDLEAAASALSGSSASDPGPDATTTQVLAPVAAVDHTETRVQAASAPEPVRRPPSERPTPATTGGRALWLGVLAVVVLAVGLLVVARMAGDRDDGETATAETTETTAPPETAAPAAAVEPSEPSSIAAPTTTATTTTAPAEDEEDAGQDAAGDPADTAVTYLRTLDADRLDDAWAMTTPRFQAQQDREQWESFWLGHAVKIVGEPRVDGGTVIVPISYDGQREDYRLDLVRQGGGWLIDGPVGR